MKLTDLDPHFLKRVPEWKTGTFAVDSYDLSKGTYEKEYWQEIWHYCSFEEADGVQFLCPKCYQENNGSRGTHSVLCWRPQVPPEIDPKPGRWEFQGTGYNDLTLVAGSSSILLMSGCQAHFYIQNGEIRMS